MNKKIKMPLVILSMIAVLVLIPFTGASATPVSVICVDPDSVVTDPNTGQQGVSCGRIKLVPVANPIDNSPNAEVISFAKFFIEAGCQSCSPVYVIDVLGPRGGITDPLGQPVLAGTITAAPPVSVSVLIDDGLFVPSSLAISSGTTVDWTNVGTAPHSVACPDAGVHSPLLNPGDMFSFAFNTAGNFQCFDATTGAFMTVSVA